MKIAITVQDENLESPVDPRFGRARYLLIVDTDSQEQAFHDNTQNLNAVRGAGIQAAENVVRFGANALLTGHCGPKAFRALKAAGIEVYVGVSGSVRDVLDRFNKGEYSPAAGADVEGHW